MHHRPESVMAFAASHPRISLPELAARFSPSLTAVEFALVLADAAKKTYMSDWLSRDLLSRVWRQWMLGDSEYGPFEFDFEVHLRTDDRSQHLLLQPGMSISRRYKKVIRPFVKLSGRQGSNSLVGCQMAPMTPYS